MLSSKETLRSSLVHVLPAFAAAPPELWAELLEHGSAARLPANRFLRMAGESCEHFPIVLSGEIRVFAMGEGGREVTLYDIGPGESCILTASCILNGEHFPAFARTRTAAELVLVPSSKVPDWFDRFAPWRTYLLDLVSRRLGHVIEVVEQVTFVSMGQRIARYLLSLAATRDRVETTHGEIAAELGTAREVVSRTLKALEAEGLVALGRGSLEIKHRERLEAKAGRILSGW